MATTHRGTQNGDHVDAMAAPNPALQWLHHMNSQPLAYLMPEFLASDDARPIRILAEDFQPLRRFRAQDIQDTVVFFGSARTRSRDSAEQALAALASHAESAMADEIE